MHRLPRPAQYLLRVDDLCPTMNHQRWSSIRNLVRTFQVRPILAVVPDNQDCNLKTSPPNDRFWEEMREMQSGGATIAMHGYQHQCTLHGESLVPLHLKSEFAGLAYEEQCNRIRAGAALLRDNGLSPRLFVAPNHSFDRTTLRALRDENLPYLCDGFVRIPFMRGGVTWIPQQLWSPVSRSDGLWTICIHPDSTDSCRSAELRRFLERHAGQFTSFSEVVEKFLPGRLSLAERLHERLALWRVMLRLKRERMCG